MFKYKSEPWIDPDGATAAAIIETIRKCPSGALSYTIDGVAGGEQGDLSITVAKDGPYMVAGGAQLLGQPFDLLRGRCTARFADLVDACDHRLQQSRRPGHVEYGQYPPRVLKRGD